MCNTSGPLLSLNFSHDNPTFDNLREELMAQNPAVKEFLEGEVAQEEKHEEQFEAALGDFRGTADTQSANCEAESILSPLFHRI